METTLPEYIGPYRIIQKLGEGGMGAVFQAIQTPIERTVALKTLHLSHAGNKSMVARFLNEAKTLGKLQHPNVVQVIDYGTTSAGVAYLVMEFLRGETLSKRLKMRSQRRSSFPLLSILQLGFQVADALACAHANGIIHRDTYVISKVCFHVGHFGPQRRRNRPCPLTVPAAASFALTSH